MVKRKYSINDGSGVLPATKLWSAVCGLPSCRSLMSPIKKYLDEELETD